MTSLAGRTAVVTGASRGVGRATALRLADGGALVAVHYSTGVDEAGEVVDTIRKNGGTAFAVQADLSAADGPERLWSAFDEGAADATGEAAVDILVNNAATSVRATLEETGFEDYERMFAVNVRAPFFMIQQALGRLRNGARIVNVTSAVTRMAFPEVIAYGLTKGALNTLTLRADRQVKPLVDGFSTKKSVSTKGFVCLSTRRASTCPVLPCVSCPPNSVSAAKNSVPGGGV
ncbi:SDR family NAD(P)-dependent oxidoreductase [Streptomyces sp. NPDC087903]|uniref:SDR family NAD(P)-dependent oxidoreductase n=1 Tax=Streptomyces sp. NPDC087903 TaxID=3365819 RepID=UPI00382E8576